MIQNKKISLVLPSRSVSKILSHQLDIIPDFIDEIIVVSNKSKDDTYAKALEYSKTHPRVVALEDDRVDESGIGYGYAIQSGFKAATGDYIFKADFDGTYPIEEIKHFVETLIAENKLIAIGTRYPVKENSKVKLFNSVGVWVLNTVSMFKNGYRFSDILCGLYGGQKNAVKNLNLEEGGWNLSVEFKLKSAKMYKNLVKQFHIEQRSQMTASNQKYFQTGWLHLNYIIFS
jgi:glycosyltransferase involved in cell wall biosynthesis